MRWVAPLLAVVVNIVFLALAVAPAMVTYAQVPPPDIVCISCVSPDVQIALAQAAASGRAQIVGQLHRMFPVLCALGVVNIALVSVLTVLYVRKRVA